jgi:hypothetical protein
MIKNRLIDNVKPVMGCAPAALTSTAGDGDYVSLKNFHGVRITLAVLNGATVTGGTITLKQASAVAGTGEKALAFTKMWANTDCAAADTLTETAVTSNTFTTDTTNSKQLMYVMEVNASDLDVANGFDCVRIDSTGMANAVGCVLYDLYPSRYASPLAVAAITD